MKHYYLFFVAFLLLFSCKKENKLEKEISKTAVSMETIRFDQLFYTASPNTILELKKEFPYLFPESTPDSVWINKLKDPLLQELYNEVQKKYSTIEALKTSIEELQKHILYYFPNTKTPQLITLISEVDRESKAIYTPNFLFISLDCYLGKDHKFYADFPAYIAANMNESQILPNVVESFATAKIPYPKASNLLAEMIYEGKKLYFKDKLIPKAADSTKIGYTHQQLEWSKANEKEIWQFFVENNLLYDTQPKTLQRFVYDAPFSKFYLEIDAESPGRIGTWIGWQIVRSYMANNPTTTLQELAILDAKELFEKSKYKPKK